MVSWSCANFTWVSTFYNTQKKYPGNVHQQLNPADRNLRFGKSLLLILQLGRKIHVSFNSAHFDGKRVTKVIAEVKVAFRSILEHQYCMGYQKQKHYTLHAHQWPWRHANGVLCATYTYALISLEENTYSGVYVLFQAGTSFGSVWAVKRNQKLSCVIKLTCSAFVQVMKNNNKNMNVKKLM